MNVFLCWSGERSREAALKLHACLNGIFNSDKNEKTLNIWMSAADIGSGQRWSNELEDALKRSEWAIVCLSPECADKPWMLFEAGAISAGRPDNRVVPYLLFGLKGDSLPAPFAQFKAIVADRPGTFRLLHDLNKSLPQGALLDRRLDELIDTAWCMLEEGMKCAERTTLAHMEPWHALFTVENPDVYEQEVAKAAEIWLAGVTLEDTLTTYKRLLMDRVAAGCELRVLLAKAKSSVLLPAVLRKEAQGDAVRKRMAQKRDEIQASKEALKQIARDQANAHKTVQIRETRYPLAFNLQAIDPHTFHGVLYIKFYPYRVERKPKPLLVLHANRDLAYKDFWRELQELFKGGDDITSEVTGGQARQSNA